MKSAFRTLLSVVKTGEEPVTIKSYLLAMLLDHSTLPESVVLDIAKRAVSEIESRRR